MNKNELIAKCIENRILKEKLFKSGIIIHKAGNGEWDIDIRLFRTCESGRLITTIGEKLRVRIFEMSSSTPIPNAMVTKIIDDFETDGACETFGTLNVGCIVSFRKKAFKFEDIDESIIDELISNLLIEISDEQLLKASGNKDYGKDINKRIAAAGGSYHAITTYWKMHWKNEVSPEEFMGLVNSAAG